MATTHYNRVIADGGVLPSGISGLGSVLDSVIAAYGVTDSTDFNTKVPVFLDPHYTGYKLGAGSGTTLGQAAQKVYSVYAGIPQVSDPDAQSFIYRVYTAGGELTTTEANATNQLVLDMKSAGIWASMKAVYPMVGASAAACAQNLVSSSFTGSFLGGMSYSSNGITPNGTNATMDTNFNVLSNLSTSSAHLSFYSRTNANEGKYDFSTNFYGILAYSNVFYVNLTSGGTYTATYPLTNTTGFYIGSRINNTNVNGYRNGSKVINNALLVSLLPSENLFLSSQNGSNYFSSKNLAFASIGDGLDDTQAANFYTSVQAFQTTLSRNV
jgi:hypothetical protein